MFQNKHITPHKDGWAVKGEGANRASSVPPTQVEAIELGCERFIHRRDCRIRARDTPGKDPYSTKG